MTRTAPPPSLIEVIEAARLSALHSYGILDSGMAPEFDQLAEFMAQSVRAPVALISFIDRNRQWVKAGVGFPVAEVPRYLSSRRCAVPGAAVLDRSAGETVQRWPSSVTTVTDLRL